MPTKSYALDPGGPERVSVTWDGAFKNLTLSLDDTALGTFASVTELGAPQLIPLNDGSRLELSVAKFGPFPELRISRDGVALPGSSGDPHTQLAGASTMLFLVASLNAGLGFLTELGDISVLRSVGLGWGSVVAGAVYAGLAWMVTKRSTAALGIAVALFVIDGLFTFVAAAQANVSPPVGGVIARIFFLMPMIRGFGAIRELAKPPQRARPPQRPPVASPARSSVESMKRSTAPELKPPTPGAADAPVATTTAARVLTGEAEKRRLSLSEKTTASAPTLSGRKVEVKGPPGVDAARKALRFVAHKVEIEAEGLQVTFPTGERRDVGFASVTRITTRQLPPDPPWEGAFLIDVVADASGAGPLPCRIFATTTVNYAAVPGTASTSRLENTRRLTAFLRDRCKAAEVDEDTAEFIRGPKVPKRFANMTQFVEYDSMFG